MVPRSPASLGSPLLAGLICLAGAALSGCRDAVNESADAPSFAVVSKVTWDPKSQMVQVARTKGCDSYTPTWAPDNNLYTAVGDCRPRNVPQKIGMGFGRISGTTAYGVSFTSIPTGDPLNWDDAAFGDGADAMGDGQLSEKAAGMLHAGGRLWYLIRNISSVGTGVRLKYSDNYSTASPDFTWAPWSFPNIGYASFVQYGKGYAGGPSGYVYAVVPMRSAAAGSLSNSAYNLVPAFGLIRGARADLTLKSNWRYWCGSATSVGWCSNPARATNIMIQPEKKFTPRAGMSWNPGLRKFMLSVVYDPTPSTPDEGTRFHGGLMVLLASAPWGPWEVVFSSEATWPGGTSSEVCGTTGWGSGERADIPTKYISADGKTFYLFSSGGDCLSVARGVLP